MLSIVLLVAFTIGVLDLLIFHGGNPLSAQSRETIATVAGEAAAAHIAALVDQWPWEKRFYRLVPHEAAGLAFTSKTFPFRSNQPIFSGSEVTFRGIVGDAGKPLTYRIALELEFRGVKTSMTWVKHYPLEGPWLRLNVGDGVMVHTPARSSGLTESLLKRITTHERHGPPEDPTTLDEPSLAAIDEVLCRVCQGENPARQLLSGISRAGTR